MFFIIPNLFDVCDLMLFNYNSYGNYILFLVELNYNFEIGFKLIKTQ